MGNFAHALGHILKTGFDMTATGQNYNESQARQRQEAQAEQQRATEQVNHIQSFGGKMIQNGLVADDGPPDASGNPTKIYRPPNPDRYTAKVKVGKETFQFEVPNDAEQHAYQIGRQVKDFHNALTNPTAASDRELQQTEGARGVQLNADATNQAKEAGDERTRNRIGIALPNDIGTALGMDPNVPGSGFQAPTAAPLTDQAPAADTAAALPVGRTPEQSAAAAPGTAPKKRLLLPTELDNLATAAGKFVDYQSKADARLNPPAKPKTVHNVAYSADGKTQINTYSDGTIEEKPLVAGAKPTETETEVSLASKIGKIKAKGKMATPAEVQEMNGYEIALKRLDQSKREARPINVNNIAGPGSVDAPSTSAQTVARYGMDFNRALPYRATSDQRDQFLKQVLAVNPQFKAENYPIYIKTEENAITGEIGRQAGALNTMIGHLGVLQEAAGDLKNGNVQALNQLANAIGAQTGNDAVTTYRTIVHRLGPEVTKAYVAGGGSAGERGSNEEDFADKLGGDQIQRNIGVSAVLAESLIKSLEKRHADGTFGQSSLKMLTDEHRQILDHLRQSAPKNIQSAGPRTGGNRQPPAGQVAVIAPDGTPGFMTKEALAAAQAKGQPFKLAP